MKIAAAVLAILLLASTSYGKSYSTNFFLTENPISEGSNWTNGLATGGSWSNIRTTPGEAFGTQDGNSGFNDSIAVLGSGWAANQTVQATVKSVVPQCGGNAFQEVELLLHFTITAGSATGYEVLFRVCNDGSQYAEIVRWNGGLGSFTQIGSASVPPYGGITNGSIVMATIVGSTITGYVNGVAVMSATDSTYTTGSPGMGFYNQGAGAGNNANWGFSTYDAIDGTGNIWTAATCAQTDITSKVTSASDDDILFLKTGTCTWSTTFSISKALIIHGSGIGNTIINDAYVGETVMVLNCVAGHAHRMFGIEFRGTGVTRNFKPRMKLNCISTSGTTFRADHNYWNHLDDFGWYLNDIIGVFDHNTCAFAGSANCYYVFHPAWNNVGSGYGCVQMAPAGGCGDNSWADPITWGSPNMLYFEDETVTHDGSAGASGYGAWDSYGGARYVVRFSTLTGTSLECHGTDTAGRPRGCRQVEMYSNAQNTTQIVQDISDFRSGSAMIWNNNWTVASGFGKNAATLVTDRTTFSATFWLAADGQNPWDNNTAGNPVTIANGGASCTSTVCTVSSFDDPSLTLTVSTANWTPNIWRNYEIRKIGCVASNCASVITSNGTNTITFENGDGHPAGSSHMVFTGGDTFDLNLLTEVLDQPGRGGGTLLTGASPSVPVGWNNQTDDPSYEWLNSENGTQAHFSVHTNCPTCRINEHYFNYDSTATTSATNQTAGVRSGTFINRPNQCTAGVAYWATNVGTWNAGSNSIYTGQGSLYKCGPANSWTLIYTPYTYPHPLTNGSSGGTTPSGFVGSLAGAGGLVGQGGLIGSGGLK